MVIEQIKHQLGRLVPVHKVNDLTLEGPFLARELALIKVVGTGEKRVEALRIADIFRARAVDTSRNSFVFEIAGSPEKIDAFIALMKDLGLVELHAPAWPPSAAAPARCNTREHSRHIEKETSQCVSTTIATPT